MDNRLLQLPPPITTRHFTDPEKAVEQLLKIYKRNTEFIYKAFQWVMDGESVSERFRAYYPEITMRVDKHVEIDTTLAYGFVPGAGIYTTTITNPKLFYEYLIEQLSLLIKNHGKGIEIGESCVPIPLHFALPKDVLIPPGVGEQKYTALRDIFDVPTLSTLNDTIANRDTLYDDKVPQPLSHFEAPRIDYSLHRLQHYTATSPEYFQKFVLFTNYSFYINEFVSFAYRMMSTPSSHYTKFVRPGNILITPESCDKKDTSTAQEPIPQMPAYHLVAPNDSGITIVNIGIGPSNAKLITDHVAVLRPDAWILLGHCAGLSGTQKLGDYVLAHAYVRNDHVLDADLPACVPIPALSEIQLALAKAVADITGLSGLSLKSILRTGTVASVDNRNWELRGYDDPIKRLSQSRAIALDMESATVAANGFRFRVPYGILLCVSDKPLHGELKLASMASEFYRKQVKQHLMIGIRALELLRSQPFEVLHSRKLRSFEDVAFK